LADKLMRIAIVNHDKCKPKKCQQECRKSCPVVQMGELCIEVTLQNKIAWISETLCIGCGICIKKCPFGLELMVLETGKQKPNLGKYDDPPDWQDILTYFRESELQNYFTKILEENLKAIIKSQYVDQIPKPAKGTTQAIVCQQLELTHLTERNVEDLSGGELQRFACAVICIQKADIFMFGETSSYLDVKQHLKPAITIQSLINPDRYIIVVEYDLGVLDYLSDFNCCLYGVPSTYGVVTVPFSVRKGINIFLDGYVPTENLRFQDASLVFKVAETANEEEFELAIVAGEFTDSEIMVMMLGENGMGKTTFIRMLAGRLKPDEEGEVPVLNVSYKLQKISPKLTGSVRQLLHEKIRDAYTHPQFVTNVMKPLQIENIIDQEVQTLSGGELQRVALALCLGKPADVYLIDEPSAYLDSEQRLMAARVVKRFILHAKKTAFVVEHDFIMATYLADHVIIFYGVPSTKNTVANSPQTLLADPNHYRPRINKFNLIKDVEQKKSGNYFFLIRLSLRILISHLVKGIFTRIFVI
uniref:ATP binding cassette subfamily E member 1 n=1 Tax=Pan paniscus TaxID=9597 RepID=A0A2R9AP09_PANPA